MLKNNNFTTKGKRKSNMKHTITKLMALVMCLITLFSFVPAVASADEDPFPQNVTIESEKNNAFDYLEYYSGGKWKDLNTPKHWIESTGQVCYCIEHSEGNPHGASYTATPPSQVFSANTLAGLQTILMYGYPCNTPDGFTEDEARQATANAIRFWLSENGEPGSYSFTNRKAHPTYIRAKKGYEHVLTWADELLQMARDKKTLSHNIEFTPSALTLTKSGDTFTGKTTVKLTNINSGYTLDTSGLPAGVTVTGYSGTKGEVLTITAPSSAAGKTFNISAAGKDTRALQNMTAYVPSNDSLQKIFLCANTAQVVATASIGVNTPATGALQIKKYGDGNKPLAGVKFAVYSDAACTKKVTEVTTGNDGAVLIENLDGGTYYVKEIGTVKPYVIDGLINTVIVKASETATLEVYNETAKGQIRITKKAETLVSTTATATEFGQLHRPNYKEAGLPGCTFTVKDSTGTVIATLTTDSNGYCETGLLPFGQYTVQETAVPAGYTIDDSVRTVNLEYKDQYTPIVYGDVAVTNSRIPTSVKIKKMTDFFDTKTMKFVEKPLEGAIFGLYTAENIGIIPKNTMVDLLTTGADGTATSTSVLPFGKYYLRELKLPDNTIHLSSESYPLEVKGNNTDYVKEPIWNERFKGNIAIWKEDDSNPGRMLEGAQYEVRDKDGLLYCTMVTDKDGYALSIDLPVGTYYMREVVPPAGFILSDEVIEVKITTDDKNTIVFERDNTPNHVVLKKTDLTTGKPVPDAMIVITNEKGDVIFEGETDLNGEIILYELPAGKYTYKETVAADGYAINDETFTFTVDYYGKVTGTTEITDEPVCLQIDKVDLFTGKPFPYVEFQLVDQDDQVIRTIVATMGAEAQVKAAPVSKSIVISNADDYRIWAKDGQDTFFVDENGHVEFRYLPAGEYRLIEVAPDGYIAEDSISITLTDHDSVSNPKVVRVENCPTGIKILKDNTMKNYIYMFNMFVRPVFGQKLLISVKNSDVKRFYNHLMDQEGLKISTIDNVHNVLHQVFEVGVNDRLIRINPADKMLKELKRAHSTDVKKREALSADEQTLFLNYLWSTPEKRRWYPIFFIMLNTGMRVGEATALRWCDVNMEENTISINHTLVYYDHMDSLGTYYSMNTPKSQAGNRIIPMTEKVKEAFLMEKRLQEDAGITCDISIDGYTDFVFLNRFGKVQTMSMLNKALKRIMRDCNDQILSNAEEDEDVVLLPPFSCHVLRHTFATRLCESGMNIKVIQSVLGHADLSTTINTYIHATEDFKKEEFSKQSRYLSIGAADLESETILS